MFQFIFPPGLYKNGPSCPQLQQHNGHSSGKKQVVLSPIMLLLVATLSLIKITQGYSLKNMLWAPHDGQGHLTKNCVWKTVSDIAWPHSTTAKILLVTSACGTWEISLPESGSLSWGSPVQRVCLVCDAWEQGELPVLPHSPLVLPGVLCIVAAFAGAHGQGKGSCDAWLSIMQCWVGFNSIWAKHWNEVKGNVWRKRSCKEPETGKEEGHTGAIRSHALNSKLNGVWVCLVLGIQSCLLHGNLWLCGKHLLLWREDSCCQCHKTWVSPLNAQKVDDVSHWCKTGGHVSCWWIRQGKRLAIAPW